MNYEFGNVWKKAAMLYAKVLSRYFLGGIEENQKRNINRAAGVRSQNRTPDFPNTKPDWQLLYCDRWYFSLVFLLIPSVLKCPLFMQLFLNAFQTVKFCTPSAHSFSKTKFLSPKVHRRSAVIYLLKHEWSIF